MTARRLIRLATRWLIWSWLLVPPALLAVEVISGRSTLPEAADLAIWLVLPWLAVLAGLIVARAILGPYRPRPARPPGGHRL